MKTLVARGLLPAELGGKSVVGGEVMKGTRTKYSEAEITADSEVLPKKMTKINNNRGSYLKKHQEWWRCIMDDCNSK